MFELIFGSKSSTELKSLNNQLRLQLYTLHNLFEITLELNSILDENQLIHSYLLNIFGLLGIKSAAILTDPNQHSDSFSASHYRGFKKSQANSLTIKKSEPLLEILRKKPRVFFVENLNKMGISTQSLNRVESIGGHLLTPIVHRNKLLGIVLIGEKHNKKLYSQSEVEILSLLTNFLAVALTNVRLYKEMERVSVTDPLTGLFNRRYFENFLQNEVSRARRFNHPLSLVMLDVDHFKNYNDCLGHPAGDRLLQQLANVLTKTARSTDILARYGGEEFCVILPEIGQDGALSFSERLRNLVFSYPFEKREIQPNKHITISLGTATYPSDAQMMKELVVKADMALYQAKKMGRNQVIVYSESMK